MSTEVQSHHEPGTLEQGKRYLKASRKYYDLKIFQLLATLSTSLVEALIVGSLLLFAAVFGAIAGAIALGDLLQNPALGWILVALVFIGLAGLTLALRKKLYRPIIQKLSKTYFS
ncbi:hypothetical protein SAMN04490243_2839 [Robiginitalea myxolifaciens]|uniref:Holin-X, holin superfamily III n=1 Tax=Robiginitalea myxolifaciens TaxID=400055 RepID=A0A1I6HK80_9FLAO|nr:hypothetical protein [Robiginitalea myxolifaciens]SFR54852.1 hypothetical protein SAMN04490243_2839 [Robiginitalea myxolifaciens]